MVELPKTEAELEALLNQVREETAADFNGKFANERKTHKEEIEKLKATIGKSAEELAEQKVKEQHEAEQQELQELRTFKKTKLIEERLGKEGLPNYFKNDQRLIGATEEDFDSVLKVVKKEYEATIPKGSQTSTVVPTQSSQPQPNESDEGKKAFIATLNQLLG